MLKVVIIEDEPRGRETLKNLINEYCEDVEILAMAGSVKEGISAIETNLPDLVFLDIELHSGSGFEVLENVSPYDFDVVFTTAFENYAIQAIRVSAIDYLLKPIDIAELQEAVQKVKKKRQLSSSVGQVRTINQTDVENKIITLSTLNGFEFVRLADIIRLGANGAYTIFYLKDNKTIMVSKNLKEYENLLAPYDFFRAHHSFLINLREVDRYVKAEGGFVLLKDGSRVDISSRKKEKFMELMNLKNV